MLQAEIDAAPPGSEVVVPAGVHHERVRLDKPLTLRGEPGAVLDAGGKGPVVAINVTPGPPVRLIGLTLRNGFSQAGGGVSILKGVVELDDCTLIGNHAPAFGGGALYSTGQRLRVRRCRIEDNRGRQGGGVFLDGTVQASLEDCLIARNGGHWGGGLRAREGAVVTLERCTVANNVVVGEGSAGTQLHLSGTTTRRPSLNLRNSILAGEAPLLFNHPENPGQVEGSHVLAPAGALPASVGHTAGEPDFTGTGDAPFRPAPGSPAAGRGDGAGLPDAALDLAGQPRQRAGALDLGAYSLLP